jgi:hypothetical protein
MSSDRTKLRPPGATFADGVIKDQCEIDWLPALRRILHEKDQDCRLYTSDSTYVTYYGIGSILKPKSLLEVGVRFGYSLASLACGAGLKSQVFGIDEESYEVESNSYATNALKLLGIEALIYSSPSRDFDVAGRIGLSSIDLIHIDGDHTASGALRDLLHYSQFSNRLLIDDILDSRVWSAVRAFAALQDRPISQTYFNTATGLLLIER